MTDSNNNTGIYKWLPFVFGTGLFISFFLPWVSWDGILVHGYDMPLGNFFNISETKFGLENPFPQFSFIFNVFWLIPFGVLLISAFIFFQKKWSIAVFITGAVALALATVFFLFTQKLIMLGVGSNIFSMIKPGMWIHAVSAIGLIITAQTSSALLKKTAWIAAGPVFVFLSFLLAEKYLMEKTYSDTANVKADYTITAPDLIHEFAVNDSLANKKYREKIVSVNGTTGEIETLKDSTVNIKFTDTTGSYIIFSLDKNQYEKAKNIKGGDVVSVKGSCSGSLYSEILGITSISFKRSILNKQ